MKRNDFILSILKFLFPKTMDDYSLQEFARGFEAGDCSDLFAKVHEAIDNAATEGK